MKESVKKNIEKIRALTCEEIAEMHGCKPKEVCMGDYIARNTDDKKCPFKVIMGFANFEYSNCSLGKLEFVYGKKMEVEESFIKTLSQKYRDIYTLEYWGLSIKNSEIDNLENLKAVYGAFWLNENIRSLANLEYLGSNLYLNKTNIEDLGELKIIEGRLNIENMHGCLTNLGKLEKVGLIYIDSKDLNSAENLQSARIDKTSKVSTEFSQFIRNNFIENNGEFKRKDLTRAKIFNEEEEGIFEDLI